MIVGRFVEGIRNEEELERGGYKEECTICETCSFPIYAKKTSIRSLISIRPMGLYEGFSMVLTPLYPRCFDPSGGCGASIFTSCGRAKNLADYPYIKPEVSTSDDHLDAWRCRDEGSAFVERRRNESFEG